MRLLSACAAAVVLCASFAYAEEPKAIESKLGEWATVTHPAEMAPGKTYDVVVKLNEAKAGQFVTVNLNQMLKGGKFGKTNAAGKPGKQEAVAGDIKFTVTPKANDEVVSYSLAVFLSPDGAWKSKTESGTAKVALAKPADTPKTDAPKTDAPKTDGPKTDGPKNSLPVPEVRNLPERID